jgi:hypothetical protein
MSVPAMAANANNRAASIIILSLLQSEYDNGFLLEPRSAKSTYSGGKKNDNCGISAAPRNPSIWSRRLGTFRRAELALEFISNSVDEFLCQQS